MKKKNLFLLLIPLFLLTSCASTFARIGYGIGKLVEWSLILSGIIAVGYILLMIIAWIIEKFK